MQFAGIDWTEEEMTARCDQETGGTFSTEGCGEAAAGWCHKSIVEGSKSEVTAMTLHIPKSHIDWLLHLLYAYCIYYNLMLYVIVYVIVYVI